MKQAGRAGERGRGLRRARPVILFTTAVGLLCATAYGVGSFSVDASAKGGTGTGCAQSAETRVPQPSRAVMEAAGLGRLPVAPDRVRADLVAPAFPDPTKVTNPLFPISRLHSAVLNGKVQGKTFRTETTLLPDTRVIEWSRGQCVKVLVSQYVAYLDGRIEEAALDYYAQGADGSVWYFGEDVFNFAGGVVADLLGTWFAGKEGPAAMIMPARPRVGDVNRPENIPGLVFEEVAISKTGQTVQGPSGPVQGAIVGRQLHDDGSFSDKIFAPGYGEFFTDHDGDVEAMALAVPTDAVRAPLPGELRTMHAGATTVIDAVAAGLWDKAQVNASEMKAAWDAYRKRGGVPPRLKPPVDSALKALSGAIEAENRVAAQNGALDVAQATLDLQLRYRPPVQIDHARMDLWAQQAGVDAASRDRAGLRGDIATMEWIRDRVARALDPVGLTRIDTLVVQLRENVRDNDLVAAAKTADELRKALSAAPPRG